MKPYCSLKLSLSAQGNSIAPPFERLDADALRLQHRLGRRHGAVAANLDVPLEAARVSERRSSVGQRPVANIVDSQLGVDHKNDFVCTGSSCNPVR
jgi:hypothetical protein